MRATDRSSLSAGISKAATLTKTAIIGKAAPSRLKKTGVLVLDGHRRYCKLGGGNFTIYAADSKAEAAEDKAIFRAPIKFIKVVGYGPGGRRETAQPSEIKLYVEPEALNQEHNAQNHSNFGFGWHPMNLRVGHQENVSQFSGDVRRQHFSLFAQDKTEKHAWHTTLNTVTNSSREWAYVGHEIKDSCAYITGKKK